MLTPLQLKLDEYIDDEDYSVTRELEEILERISFSDENRNLLFSPSLHPFSWMADDFQQLKWSIPIYLEEDFIEVFVRFLKEWGRGIFR